MTTEARSSANNLVADAFELGCRMAAMGEISSTSPFINRDLSQAWERGFLCRFYNEGYAAGLQKCTRPPAHYEQYPSILNVWNEGCDLGFRRRCENDFPAFKRKKKNQAAWSRDGF